MRIPNLSLALVAMLLGGCEAPPAETFQGYVEGEYVYVSVPVSGFLASLDAARGTRVEARQPLFSVTADPEQSSLEEAEAKSLAAGERAANLRAARRTQEIARLEASVRAAEAALDYARSQLERNERLVAQKFIAQSRLDEAQNQHDQALAQLQAARAELDLYRKPIGREAEAQAAAAEVQAARAAAAQKRWLVEHRTATAPIAGDVAETYYRPGEWVPAGKPVVSILPDSGRRLRFFVPQARLSQLRMGQRVEASCDGCDGRVQGVIDFIAPQAEYTPPVIYSRESRDKLVFRVEAVPVPGAQDARLIPGLPLDVHLPGE